VSSGEWYDYDKIISDSSNYGYGRINYHILRNGFGFNNTYFNKYNGVNISAIPTIKGVWSEAGNTPLSATSFFGSTNNASLRFRTNNNSVAVLDSLGKFGIGITSPTAIIHAKKDTNAATGSIIENVTSGTAGQSFLQVKSTKSGFFSVYSPTTTANGSILPNDVSLLGDNTRLNLAATAGEIIFSTTTGTNTPIEAARISQGRNFLIGQTVDDATNKLQVTGTTKFTGNTNITGIASVTGTSTFSDLATITYTGVEGLRMIGSNATRATLYSQATNSASQSTFYFENNRGSFASYGGLLHGGSANSNALFGISRADKTVLFHDGGSGLGFMTGTLNAQPYIIGTNNAERARFISGGQFGIGVTSPTALIHIKAGTTTASTAPLKLTTGTNMTAAEAGAFEYTTPQLFFTNGGAQRQEIPQIQQSRVSTQYDNTTTTLGNVTGLTSTVVAGKIYRFEATLFSTSDVAGGIKAAIGGTATATAIRYEVLITDAGATTQGRQTALAGTTGVTAVTAAFVKIQGTITVNAAGTITVQAAQNANTGTTSVLTGSTFVLTEML